MKKFYLLVTAFIVMTLGTTFNSCGDDKDDSNSPVQQDPAPDNKGGNGQGDGDSGGDNGNGGNGGNGGDAMTIADQKVYLEKVANTLMEEVKADDFRAIADLGDYVNKTYVDKYDWDNVGEWAKDCFEALRVMVGDPVTQTNISGPYDYGYGSYAFISNYITTNYKAWLQASNFCSQFRAQNGRWVRSDANDLEFIFTDQNRQECVLKLTTSGIVKPVHVGKYKEKNRESETDYSSTVYNVDQAFITNTYYNYTDATIGVPEVIEVTLTQGGSQVVKATVKTDLSNLTGEEFDLNNSSLSMSILVELNNGYKVGVNQVAYTPNSKAAASVEVTKNGKQLVSVSVAGDVSGIPQANVSALVNNESDANFDNVAGKNALAKIDVLGMFQLQGTLQDVRKFADYIKKADDNKYNENTFKSYMEQANSLATLNAYYDNTETVQAAVKFEAFQKKKWKYNYSIQRSEEVTYWEMEPVLLFFDGSSYSLTMDAFFDRDDFKGVIDNFKRLTEQYADLIDLK